MKRNTVASKLEHILRNIMVSHYSGSLPLIVIAEFPKSGGSWLGQMLAEYLKLPFPRNRFPPIGPCIMHGHYLYSPKMKNVFPVVRDGRDVMVSWYHHCYFVNDKFNQRLVTRMRNLMPFSDYMDVSGNLEKFIEFVFSTKRPIGFTWADFIDSWKSHSDYLVRYEKLLSEPVPELTQALQNVLNIKASPDRLREIIETFSFENQAKRDAGDEVKSSFLRKGVAGDWKNYFGRGAKEVFNYFAGEKLLMLGYENDQQWVS